MIEASPVGVKARMVLAGPPSPVTGGLEDFPDEGAVAEVTVTSVMIQPRQETDPGRPALGGVVGLGIADSVPRQAIQVGRPDLSAVTSEIRVSHVVGHDENDVRPTC